jgi:hypothetical protein
MIDLEYATCSCTAMNAPEESPDTEVCSGSAPYAGSFAGAATASTATKMAIARMTIDFGLNIFFTILSFTGVLSPVVARKGRVI